VLNVLDDAARQRLATAIRSLRGDRSQKEFANFLEVSQSTITNWEGARGGTPTLDNIEKIAKLRKELPETFVAFLFGRDYVTNDRSEQTKSFSDAEIDRLSEAIATKLKTIK